MHTIIMTSCPGLTLIGLSGTAQDQPLACSRQKSAGEKLRFQLTDHYFLDGGGGGEGFGYACFLACGFRTDSRACLWVLTSFVLSPLEFPVSHESKKMAVVCFTQGTCVMEHSDNNMWFNTETTRLSPTPGFCLLISSLWVGLICYCWWHAFSLFIPV